jgi:hypothetical protein
MKVKLCCVDSCYRYSRMRTVTQSHEGQQRPVMLDRWILAVLKTNPSLDFWTPRVVEVDNADKRR